MSPTCTLCLWLLWRYAFFCRGAAYSGSGYLPFQLATGRMPFPDSTDSTVSIMVSKGKRPSKPARFEAPGITPAVWKIAEKCWHQKARERPEAKAILWRVENLANPGEYTHETFSCLLWGLIDLQPKQVRNGHSPALSKYGVRCGTEPSRREKCGVCRVLQYVLYWMFGCKIYSTISLRYYFYVLPLVTMMSGRGNTLLTSASTATLPARCRFPLIQLSTAVPRTYLTHPQ